MLLLLHFTEYLARIIFAQVTLCDVFFVLFFFYERPGAQHFSYSSSSLQNYKDTLQAQVLETAGERLGTIKFGTDLAEGKLNDFQGDQIGQLYELMLESTKPNRQFNIQEDIKWSSRLQKYSRTNSKGSLMCSEH